MSELKVSEAAFLPEEEETEAEEPTLPDEPEQPTMVSPANALVTALVELDIAEALRADAPVAEAPSLPAPLSQRHLETIDRLVDHLKADETRLEQQIADSRRRLADTRLARHVFERNSADLRRGIAVLARPAAAGRQQRIGRAAEAEQPAAANDAGDAPDLTEAKTRGQRKVH